MKHLTFAKSLFMGAAVTLGVLLLATHTVHAGYRDYYNRSDSHYAIKVYEGRGCTSASHTVQPGHTYGNGQSYKVGAYSKFKIGSGSYSSQVSPNVCVTIVHVETVTVYVYSNA